jgi:hypothetical protein
VSRDDLDILAEIIRHLKVVVNLKQYNAHAMSLFKIVRDMLDQLVHQIDTFLANNKEA